MDCIPPGSSIQGVFHTKILEWSAISFSRGFSQPRDSTDSAWQADSSSVSCHGSPQVWSLQYHKHILAHNELTKFWDPGLEIYILLFYPVRTLFKMTKVVLKSYLGNTRGSSVRLFLKNIFFHTHTQKKKKISKDRNHFALLTCKNNDTRRHLWEMCLSDQVLIDSVLSFE